MRLRHSPNAFGYPNAALWCQRQSHGAVSPRLGSEGRRLPALVSGA